MRRYLFADVDSILTVSGSDDDTSELSYITPRQRCVAFALNLIASSDTQITNDDDAYKKK
jgi:hypothetical protein